MGLKTKFIPYHRRKRLAGVSQFSFSRKLAALFDAILAYSFAPIRLMSLAGAIFSLIGFGYAGLILVDSLVRGNSVKGWSPLMIIILVIGGFQMIMLGLIAEYLWRILERVRRRDTYFIEAIYEAEGT